mgnify:CR=1 FL=1
MSTLKVDGIRSNSATSDAITLASNGTCTANITNNLSNRNIIHNGSMVCSQRATTFASITNDYCLDRYKFRNNNGVSGTFTVSQSTESPDGFGSSLKVAVGTADTSIGSSEYFNFRHPIEGQNLQALAKGTSSAKKSVLSFYVKTNKTGVYAILFYDNDNNRQFSVTYTVSNTNWNRYTIDVPADTTGAYGNDNGSSLEIYWYLGAGSSLQSGSLASSWQSYVASSNAVGQVNFADSTSNEYYITGIQYEVNETGVATDFEHRSFGQELAICQRYFQALSLNGLAASKVPYDSTFRCWYPFKQTMRAIPTITYPSISNFQPGGATGTASGANATVDGVQVKTGSSETNSNYIPNWVNDTSAIMKASADL